MSDSTGRPPPQEAPAENRPTTEVFTAAERARVEAEMLGQLGSLEQPPPVAPLAPPEPPTERVLNRRVMAKWAIATLAIYFLLKMLVGPVREAVVDAVREEIQNQAHPVTNTAIPPVTPPAGATTVTPTPPVSPVKPTPPPAPTPRAR